MATAGHILIADDDETFLRSTADLLRREGYTCTCVHDAAAAAGMLESGDYDLLIADIRMPGNAELEFVRQLTRGADHVPIIIVTGHPSLTTAIESIHLPITAYLVKPIEFDELLKHVQMSFEYSETRRVVQGARERLGFWTKDLAQIDEALTTTPAKTSGTSVETFLELSFRNMVGALLDVMQLTELLAKNRGGSTVCHMLDCPRLGALTDGLAETITVLEKSKNAFKSKELGQLRQKLEVLLRSGIRKI